MVDKVKVICVGDQVERINGQYIVGIRHYEVARMLKELPKDKPFTLKLIEPMKAFGELTSTQTVWGPQTFSAWVFFFFLVEKCTASRIL